MASALVIQHAAVEGVGRFADWLPAHGVDLRIVRPYDADSVPGEVDTDALIVMGGPMGAYDDAAVPWLPATKALLADAVERGIPTLGVCLGAQLLAVAAGGKVERGEAGPELGLDSVEIHTPDALFDMGAIPVVQWHYDTVTELPHGAVLLGSSRRYATQAFRVGTAAWGVQFHVEATARMVSDWASSERLDPAGLVDPVTAAEDRLSAIGEQVARRFAARVTS
jgi:GMP synthase-like glutamine amidotransferase